MHVGTYIYIIVCEPSQIVDVRHGPGMFRTIPVLVQGVRSVCYAVTQSQFLVQHLTRIGLVGVSLAI